MDETLSWKEHVSLLGKKTSSRLTLLRCALKVVPKSTYVALYNTIVFNIASS